MVVAEQMKQTVDHEVRQLAAGLPPGPRGLAERRLDAQVDLPEEHGLAGVEEVIRIGEGEREHVRRAVDLAVVAVEPPDRRVIAEDDVDAGARPPEELERPPDERPKSCRS